MNRTFQRSFKRSKIEFLESLNSNGPRDFMIEDLTRYFSNFIKLLFLQYFIYFFSQFGFPGFDSGFFFLENVG